MFKPMVLVKLNNLHAKLASIVTRVHVYVLEHSDKQMNASVIVVYSSIMFWGIWALDVRAWFDSFVYPVWHVAPYVNNIRILNMFICCSIFAQIYLSKLLSSTLITQNRTIVPAHTINKRPKMWISELIMCRMIALFELRKFANKNLKSLQLKMILMLKFMKKISQN